ncbi:trypsin-like peptidase domain-containing protein [Yimella sp. cx-573]|nr:trypsin-like peptidase domain-containing protein [Yimella sp. cx-573]
MPADRPHDPSNPSGSDADITGPLPAPGERPQYGAGQPSGGDRTRAFAMPGATGAPGPGQPPNAPRNDPWATPSGGPAPMYADQSFAPPAASPQRRNRSAPWIAVPVAAVLAAGLASGTTYALTDRDTTPSSSTTTKVVQANPADFKDGSGVNWAATASKVTDSVVSITVGSAEGSSGGEGSGVVLDTKGNIVTNNHVAGAASGSQINVTLSNNLTYKAKLVGADPATDLAVIRLEKPPNGLKPVALGEDAALLVGQPVMAIGNPLGYAGTVTTGIISALNRPVTAGTSSGSGSATTNAIQTSAPINPGNSGGALVNASGQLIGINSSIASLGGSSGSSQSGNIGIGFAIPVSVVKSITSQLVSKGSVTHAQLGVKASTGSVQIGDASETAAKVAEVVPNSAAARAGVKVGDAIIAADGRPIVSSEALVGYVRAKTVGDKVELTVVRDGEQKKIMVSLGKADS